MRTSWIFSLLMFLVIIGCEPATRVEEVDPQAVCELCSCKCAPTKMDDLDFFGIYYSSCVEYIIELKEVYNVCGDTKTIPDVDTCVWALWNGGEANGTPTSGCVKRLREVAEIKMLPQSEWCGRLIPERMLCEHGIRP